MLMLYSFDVQTFCSQRFWINVKMCINIFDPDSKWDLHNIATKFAIPVYVIMSKHKKFFSSLMGDRYSYTCRFQVGHRINTPRHVYFNNTLFLRVIYMKFNISGTYTQSHYGISFFYIPSTTQQYTKCIW